MANKNQEWLDNLGKDLLRVNSVTFDRDLATKGLAKMLQGVLDIGQIILDDTELLKGDPAKAAGVLAKLATASQHLIRLEMFASADGSRGTTTQVPDLLDKLTADQLKQVNTWAQRNAALN